MTTYLENFTAEEIYNLFDHLKTFSHSSNAEEQISFVLQHFKNFFVNLNIIQENELTELIKNKNIQSMQKFINENPKIEIDKSGTTRISQIPGWKVQCDSLNYSYTFYKNKKNLNSVSRQIIKARELTCLKNINNMKAYSTLLLKANSLPTKNKILINKIDTYKKELNNIIDEKFFSKLLSYYISNNCETFITYVLYYLDIIKMDKNDESSLKKEYLTTINNIL